MSIGAVGNRSGRMLPRELFRAPGKDGPELLYRAFIRSANMVKGERFGTRKRGDGDNEASSLVHQGEVCGCGEVLRIFYNVSVGGFVAINIFVERVNRAEDKLIHHLLFLLPLNAFIPRERVGAVDISTDLDPILGLLGSEH